MINSINSIENWKWRLLIIIGALTVLLVMFLFQHFNYIEYLVGSRIELWDKRVVFSINKSIRFLINDSMTVLVIYAVFYERKYVLFAIVIQLFGMLVLLPTYLVAKWYYPVYNGPMINYLHRLTLNPILLMLLIPVLIFQKRKLKSN